MERFDTVVIGAGVVGLAIAREAALAGGSVLVLESTDRFGAGNSSRNSEVIHSGIYYPPGSLKARFCARGRSLLYGYCEERSIPFRRCGKLIVATDASQMDALEGLAFRARENGIVDVRQISAVQAAEIEPDLVCYGALESPSTGIIDSHALMSSLLADGEAAGALIAYRSPVNEGTITRDGIALSIGGYANTEILARRVFNAAGLGAIRVAAAIQGVRPTSIPTLRLAKGNYFKLLGRTPFSRLIYPVPERDGLGVHLTLDLNGRARFGPDVEWVDSERYDVDPSRAESFYAAIRAYWPALPDHSLAPDYSGIRPKLEMSSGGSMDFVVQGAAEHGVPGLVNLFGIESPGLTSCLAIAEFAVGRV